MTNNDDNTSKNPFFKNVDRPMYELGTLLRQLPYEITPGELTPETRLIAEAVRQHASNGIATAFRSIQSLGELMTIAAMNDQADISSSCQIDLGCLFQSVGAEGQFMSETEDSMRYLLDTHPSTMDELCKRVAKAT